MTPRAKNLITELQRVAGDCKCNCQTCDYRTEGKEIVCRWKAAVGSEPRTWEMGGMLLTDSEISIMSRFGADRVRRINPNSVTLMWKGNLLARIELTDNTNLFKDLAVGEEVSV